MSAAKRLAVLATLAFAIVAFTAASSWAQGGAPNPTGGTSAKPAVYEGSGPADIPAIGAPFGSGLRGWFLGLRISRQTAFFRTSSYQGRTQIAMIQRRLWER